jgi:large subunit ribosomal protein L3
MVEAILGKKLGMTQVFAENGDVVPVTVLKAGPCVVIQCKTAQKDGYEAVQLGLVEMPAPKRLSKARDVSKGRGFAGVVKRHHFGGGGASHGSMFHRAPGSIGASAYPSRVLKGMRAAGHMGVDRVTVRNLRVVQVLSDDHTLLVRGAVPGPNGGYVIVRKAKAPHK